MMPSRALSGATEPVNDDLARRHLRGSVLLLVGRVGSMAFTISAQVILVRALSKSEFGAFAFALAITSACRILLSLGQGRTLSRFLAIYEERGQRERLFGALALVALTVVATSLVLFLAFLLWGEALAASVGGAPRAYEVLAILLLLAPLEALDEAFSALFAVFARPTSIFVRKYLLTPGLRLLVVVALYLADASAVFLAVGYVGTSFTGLVVYAALAVRLLKERGLLERHRDGPTVVLPFRDVFSFSLPSLSSDFLYLSMQTGSVVLLAHFWTAEHVAEYRAVFPAARLNQFVYMSFTLMFLPMASRLFARNAIHDLRHAYWNAGLLLAVLSFPVFVMTVAFPEQTTVLLFGERYSDAALLMAVLSIGYYCNACLGFNAHTLQVVGRVRYMLTVNVVSAVLNIALAFVLVPRLAAVGVVVANAAAMIAQNVMNQLGLRRAIGTQFIGSGFRRPYLIVALAAASVVALGASVEVPTAAAFAIAATASIVVLVLCRRELDVTSTFPELRMVPVLGRLLR